MSHNDINVNSWILPFIQNHNSSISTIQYQYSIGFRCHTFKKMLNKTFFNRYILYEVFNLMKFQLKLLQVMEDARNDGENYLDLDSLIPDIKKSQKRLRGIFSFVLSCCFRLFGVFYRVILFCFERLLKLFCWLE